MSQILVNILFISIHLKFYALTQLLWVVGQRGGDPPTEDSSFLGPSTLLLLVCTACLEQTRFSFGSLLSTDRPGGERRLLT